MQAAHDRSLLHYIYERSSDAAELVNILYRSHSSGLQLLNLEEKILTDATEAGKRISAFLHYLRHCILSWIVSTASPPRTRLGLIDSDRLTKLRLVAPVFTDHLKPLLTTSEYDDLQSTVSRFVNAELEMGELAQKGETERRTTQGIRATPAQVASSMAPKFDSLSLDLTDESHLHLDGGYFSTLDSPEQQSLVVSLLPGVNPVGTKQLREHRFAAEDRSNMLRNNVGGMLKYDFISIVPKPPPPNAGLAPRKPSDIFRPLLPQLPSPTRALLPRPSSSTLSLPPHPSSLTLSLPPRLSLYLPSS